MLPHQGAAQLADEPSGFDALVPHRDAFRRVEFVRGFLIDGVRRIYDVSARADRALTSGCCRSS